MNTFFKMRQWAGENKEIANCLSEFKNYIIRNNQENNKSDFSEHSDAIDLLVDRIKHTKISYKAD